MLFEATPSIPNSLQMPNWVTMAKFKEMEIVEATQGDVSKELGDANIFYTVICENGVVQRGLFSDSSEY